MNIYDDVRWKGVFKSAANLHNMHSAYPTKGESACCSQYSPVIVRVVSMHVMCRDEYECVGNVCGDG